MVFTTSTLFKGILCPEGRLCKLVNCIYSHDVPAVTNHELPDSSADTTPMPEPPLKKRRLESPCRESKTRQLASFKVVEPEIVTETKHIETAPSDSNRPDPVPQLCPITTDSKSHDTPRFDNNSPKHSTDKSRKLPGTPLPKPSVSLNPKLIARAPQGHHKRSRFLQLIHAEHTRLNNIIRDNIGQSLLTKPASVVTEDDVYHVDELIRLVVDEEAEIAETQGSVYQNKMAARIQALKKMKYTDLIIKKRETRSNSLPGSTFKQYKSQLTSQQELAVLDICVFSTQAKKRLEHHGYVFEPPQETAIDGELSKEEEIDCDRCGQKVHLPALPCADGSFTEGGCYHHPNRFDYRLQKYPCCDSADSAFCTIAQNHVFKLEDPQAMSRVTPFVSTPANSKPGLLPNSHPVQAVAFDCEMGYTVLGFELLRLTAVTWPEGEPLIDVLVRPKGSVLDYNTPFSGIKAEDFVQKSNKEDLPDQKSADHLPIVSSTEEARALLCSYICPETPLIGHGIENDLRAVRLCHPTIVDTAVLFPHRRGMPYRRRLRELTSEHLKRSIQLGGAAGHDSLEDCRAAGDLVRVRINDLWPKMTAEGWRLDNEEKRGGKGGRGEKAVLRAPTSLTTPSFPDVESWREHVVYAAFVPGR